MRFSRDLLERSVWHDADRAFREVPKQARVRLLQMKHHREFVGRLDVIDDTGRPPP